MLKRIVAVLLCVIILTGCRQTTPPEDKIPAADSAQTQEDGFKIQTSTAIDGMEPYADSLGQLKPNGSGYILPNNDEDLNLASWLEADSGKYSVRTFYVLDENYIRNKWVVARYKDWEMLDCMVITPDFFFDSPDDANILRPDSVVNVSYNEDLSFITATDVYTDHCKMVFDFENNTFEYSYRDAEDQYAQLSALSEEELKTVLSENYLMPLMKAGSIGEYSSCNDPIGKMLTWFSNEVLTKDPHSFSQYEKNEENNSIYLPLNIVLGEIGKVYNIERYVFTADPRYISHSDLMEVSLSPAQDKGLSVDITYWHVSSGNMNITYNVLNEKGEVTCTQEAHFYMRGGKYLFAGFVDCRNYEEETKGNLYFVSDDAQGGGDGWSYAFYLADKVTGQKKSLGRINSEYNSGCGFLTNGDVYIYDTDGFSIYNADMNNPQPIFTSKINFPSGDFDNKDTIRPIFSFRRNSPDEYLIVYGEFIYNEKDTDNFFIDYERECFYKIGILDGNGNLTYSFDTGVNILRNIMGYHEVSIRLTGDNVYEIFTGMKSTETARFRFDKNKEELTMIKQPVY